MGAHIRLVQLVLAVGILVALSCGGGPGVAPPLPLARVHQIGVEDLWIMVGRGQPVILADIRTDDEFAAGHIPGSVNLPQAELEIWVKSLDRSQRICVVCT